MKKYKLPTGSTFTVVRQLCNYIPAHLVPKLARETGVEEQARTTGQSIGRTFILESNAVERLSDIRRENISVVTHEMLKSRGPYCIRSPEQKLAGSDA